MSGLTTQAEWTKHFRDRSGVLNPNNLYDKQGRPTSSNSFSFTDGKQYLEELVSLRHDTYGPKGRIEICKEKLRTAKSEWQYHQKVRDSDLKAKPTGDFALTINRLNARLKVYREEARAINAEIQKEDKADDVKLLKQQRKRAYQGTCGRMDGEIVRCDLREVENGKFVDNGESLDEYLIEVKKRKRDKCKAAAKAERLEQAEVERNNSQKIAAKKKAVETQLIKIRRRRQENAVTA